MSANFALEWQPLLLSSLVKQKELVDRMLIHCTKAFLMRKEYIVTLFHGLWTPTIKSNPNHIDNAHNSTKVDFLLRPSRLLTFPSTGIGARVMLFIFTMGI